MSNVWLEQLKSEIRLYLDNLSEFERVAEELNQKHSAKVTEIEEMLFEKYKSLRIEELKFELNEFVFSDIAIDVESEGTEEIDNSVIREYETIKKECNSVSSEVSKISKKSDRLKKDIKLIEKEISDANDRIEFLKTRINPLKFWNSYHSEYNEILKCKELIDEKTKSLEDKTTILEDSNQRLKELKQKLRVLEKECELKKETYNAIKKEQKKKTDFKKRQFEKQKKALEYQLEAANYEYLIYENKLLSEFADYLNSINFTQERLDNIAYKLEIISPQRYIDKAANYRENNYRTLYQCMAFCGARLVYHIYYIKEFYPESDKPIYCKENFYKISEECYSTILQLEKSNANLTDADIPVSSSIAIPYDSRTIREIDDIVKDSDKSKNIVIENAENGFYDDDIIEKAKKVVLEAGCASTSLLQRKMEIGYARAARIIDKLEENGVVGPHNGAKPRKVLK